MNSEVEDCLIRLENQMYGFGGVAGRSASGDRYAVEEHIRDVEGYERDARRDVVQKDARIAELTTEVVDLKSKLDFANVMNADHDKTVAELTAEVIRLRQAHEYIAKSWPDSFAARESRSVIARNALKDGLL